MGAGAIGCAYAHGCQLKETGRRQVSPGGKQMGRRACGAGEWAKALDPKPNEFDAYAPQNKKAGPSSSDVHTNRHTL